MEKEYKYKFNKEYPYLETSVLKIKDVNDIMSHTSCGRLKNLIEFEAYGVCEYDEDDVQLNHPNVIVSDKFNRLRTNVLIYNIFNNDWSKGLFDKLFIFKTNWPHEPAYSIVFHNTQTGKSVHHPEIENAHDILMQDIMKFFNTLHRREILDYYSNKAKCFKENRISDVPIEKTVEPIIERYNNAKWGKPKEQIDEEN